MRMPRDLSGAELAKRLERVGYVASRQRGSPIRLSTQIPGQHHVTISLHDPLHIGTLAAILADVAKYLEIPRTELIEKLFS